MLGNKYLNVLLDFQLIILENKNTLNAGGGIRTHDLALVVRPSKKTFVTRTSVTPKTLNGVISSAVDHVTILENFY